jgi:hypothetical protein
MSTIEILPQLRPVSNIHLLHKDHVIDVRSVNNDVAETNEAKESKESKESNTKDESTSNESDEKKESEYKYRFTARQVFIIVTVALIVVALIILIAYVFMSKYKSNLKEEYNNKLKPQPPGGPQVNVPNKTQQVQQVQQVQPKTPNKSMNHNDVINNISMDELAKYTKKPVLNSVHFQNTEKVEKLEKVERETKPVKTELYDDSSDEESFTKISMEKETHKLIESVSENNKSDFKNINQLDFKTGKIIKQYTSLEDINRDKLEYDRILRICNKDSVSGKYKNSKWEFAKEV